MCLRGSARHCSIGRALHAWQDQAGRVHGARCCPISWPACHSTTAAGRPQCLTCIGVNVSDHHFPSLLPAHLQGIMKLIACVLLALVVTTAITAPAEGCVCAAHCLRFPQPARPWPALLWTRLWPRPGLIPDMHVLPELGAVLHCSTVLAPGRSHGSCKQALPLCHAVTASAQPPLPPPCPPSPCCCAAPTAATTSAPRATTTAPGEPFGRLAFIRREISHPADLGHYVPPVRGAPRACLPALLRFALLSNIETAPPFAHLCHGGRRVAAAGCTVLVCYPAPSNTPGLCCLRPVLLQHLPLQLRAAHLRWQQARPHWRPQAGRGRGGRRLNEQARLGEVGASWCAGVHRAASRAHKLLGAVLVGAGVPVLSVRAVEVRLSEAAPKYVCPALFCRPCTACLLPAPPARPPNRPPTRPLVGGPGCLLSCSVCPALSLPLCSLQVCSRKNAGPKVGNHGSPDTSLLPLQMGPGMSHCGVLCRHSTGAHARARASVCKPRMCPCTSMWLCLCLVPVVACMTSRCIDAPPPAMSTPCAGQLLTMPV